MFTKLDREDSLHEYISLQDQARWQAEQLRPHLTGIFIQKAENCYFRWYNKEGAIR